MKSFNIIIIITISVSGWVWLVFIPKIQRICIIKAFGWWGLVMCGMMMMRFPGATPGSSRRRTTTRGSRSRSRDSFFPGYNLADNLTEWMQLLKNLSHHDSKKIARLSHDTSLKEGISVMTLPPPPPPTPFPNSNNFLDFVCSTDTNS